MNFLQDAIYLELKTHGPKTEVQIRQALKLDGWDARPRTVFEAIDALVAAGTVTMVGRFYHAGIPARRAAGGMPIVKYDPSMSTLKFDGTRMVRGKEAK